MPIYIYIYIYIERGNVNFLLIILLEGLTNRNSGKHVAKLRSSSSFFKEAEVQYKSEFPSLQPVIAWKKANPPEEQQSTHWWIVF